MVEKQTPADQTSSKYSQTAVPFCGCPESILILFSYTKIYEFKKSSATSETHVSRNILVERVNEYFINWTFLPGCFVSTSMHM